MPLPKQQQQLFDDYRDDRRTRTSKAIVPDRPWYGFGTGPVHVSVLSSEHVLEEQAKWLDSDLAKVMNCTRNHKPYVLDPKSSTLHAEP